MGTCKEPKINAGTNDKSIKSPIWFSKFSSLWCTPIILIGEFLFVLLTSTWFTHSGSYRANSNRFIENAKSKAGGLKKQKKFGFLFLIVATL
ncbi:MAG: hypothetical protein Q8K40_08350, partial [Ignavibacteria bacterium]|nr:hypothetical protein [Ignavibacteria bacterium]